MVNWKAFNKRCDLKNDFVFVLSDLSTLRGYNDRKSVSDGNRLPVRAKF